MPKQDIISYLSQNGKDKTWKELSIQFGFDSEESIRSFVKRHKRKNLQLRSRWQVQEKGGGTKWLESYRTDKGSFLETLVDKFIKSVKPHPPIQTTLVNRKGCLVLPITDFHFGAQELSLNEQRELYLRIIQNAVTRYSDPDHIVLLIGSDGVDFDNSNYTTTKGTPLQSNAEFGDVVDTAFSTYALAVSLLRQIAPTTVIVLRGNHDEVVSYLIGRELRAYFRNTDIEFILDTEPRKYYLYENVLMAFDHGDTMLPADMPLTMALEAKELWSKSVRQIVFSGDKHKTRNLPNQGTVKIYQIGTVKKANKWSKKSFVGCEEADFFFINNAEITHHSILANGL